MELRFREDILPLTTVSGSFFRVNKQYLQDLVQELETFLVNQKFMNNRTFSKKVMFSHEIKANNTVEGINDSVSVIERVIENAKNVTDISMRNRIINLYHGYQYILKRKDINENTVAELYKILSKGLLTPNDLSRMGTKYRTAPVYILQNGRLDDSMDQGINADDIQRLMDQYFNYVNNGEKYDCSTEYFIKSQIMHFYFVYIHPYFDINGRTSRTIAMWYLLNNDIYQYIIFNRGINFYPEYDRLIKNAKTRHDLTRFIEYMLYSVKKELEKEYLMHYLHELSKREWSVVDYQTIEYFLSMNGPKTVLDFKQFYNHFNDKKRNKEIFETMIEPLINDGTLNIMRETKKTMFDNQKNMELVLSEDRINQIDTSMIKRLKI